MADNPIDELFDENEESNIDYSVFDEHIKLAEVNNEYAFIKDYYGKPMIATHVYDHTYGKKTLRFISPESFTMIHCNKYIEVISGKNTKSVELGKWWLKHGKRREYETIMFDPSKTQDDNTRYNLWEGLNCISKTGTWKSMKRHIWEILCNKDEEKFKYVIKWFAWAVQNPDKRPETALVFKGKQGAGKGVVLSQFVEIFGTHGIQIASRDHLTGKFTGHLKLVVFLYADEAYYPGDKEVEGTLKNLISEDVVMREAKFISPTLEKNRLHIVMSTNNEWVIPASLDSRRFFINEISNKYAKNEISDNQRKIYFDNLWSEMNKGGREAMLYDLLNIDLTNWHPRDNVPITLELKRQQQMSVPWADRTIRDFIEDGEFPGEYTSAKQYEVKAKELYDYINLQYSDGKKSSMNAKWDVFKKLGAWKRRTAKGNVIMMPTLLELKKKWDDNYPKQDWDLTEEWIVRKSEY